MYGAAPFDNPSIVHATDVLHKTRISCNHIMGHLIVCTNIILHYYESNAYCGMKELLGCCYKQKINY